MLTKNHNVLTAEVEAHIAADAVVQGTYWDGSNGCFIGCMAHSYDATILQERFGLPLPLVRICESIFEALPEDDAKAFFAAFPGAVARDGKDLSRVHWKFLAAEMRALPSQSPKVQAVIDPVIEGMDLLAEGKAWPDAYGARARAAAGAAGTVYALAAAYAAADAAYRAAYDAADIRVARRVTRAAANAVARVAAYTAADTAARADDDAVARGDVGAAADAAYTAARSVGIDADAAYTAARSAAYAAAETAARQRQRDTILQLITEAPTQRG